ncbi:MAG: rRNA maturation RNase YbeY [Sphaerochaetaceae bacterium]|nr:rRNA maturation RNase YbeY [Sphaerochaetaceae bacterium]
MNSIVIDYYSSDLKEQYPRENIKAFLDSVCDYLKLDKCEFSVVFSDEEKMRSLNREYRNIDDSTDILSFAAQDEIDDFVFMVGKRAKRNLGDMVICPDVMKRNATSFGVSEHEELRRLLVHGILHLCGENHLTNDPSEPMLIHQENILEATFKTKLCEG